MQSSPEIAPVVLMENFDNVFYLDGYYHLPRRKTVHFISGELSRAKAREIESTEQ